MKKLNLGCGNDIKEGWVNLDSIDLQGVDIVHNITQTPFPFKNDEFDYILCQDILEHVDYIPVLKELHRILKKGGELKIRVPHFTSKNNYIDPTHLKRFSINTFYFFVKNSIFERNYYFNFSFTKIENLSLTFEKGDWVLFYNHPIEWFLNLNYRLLDIYEKTGFRSVFPAENILVKLIK